MVLLQIRFHTVIHRMNIATGLLEVSISSPDVDQIVNALPSIIETLVVAQFSALAIIFSAVFIVNQLVNTRYSAEFTDLITRSKQFQTTFLLTLGIIAVHVLSAILIPGLNNETALLIASILLVLLAVFVYLVYQFVVNMLDHLTPSQLLETYSDSLNDSEFIDKAVTAEKERKLELHPLQPVYDTTRNTVDRDELSAARTSNQYLEDMCTSHAESIIPDKLDEVDPAIDPNGDEEMPDQQNRVHTLFRTPLHHYFSSISQLAGEKNYAQLSREAANSIGEVGRTGYKTDCNELTVLAFEVLYKQTMLSVPVDVKPHSNHYPRFIECVDQTMSLIEDSVTHGELELYAHLNTRGYEVMRSVQGLLDEDELQNNDSIGRILESQARCYEQLVEDHRDVYLREDYEIEDLLGFERLGSFNYYGVEHFDPRVSALITCRLLFMATVDQYSRTTGGEDSHPSRTHVLKRPWEKLVETATRNPPEASGILIAQRYIEYLAMFVEKEDEEDRERLLESVAVDVSLVMEKGDFRVFEKAFQEIYGYEDREYELVQYNGYRGVGRTLAVMSVATSGYSEEFLDIVREIHIQSMKTFRNRMDHRCSNAVRAYTERRIHGEPLPHPTEYRLKVAEKSDNTYY